MPYVRRGKLSSGDVDILIYATDGREKVLEIVIKFYLSLSDRYLARVGTVFVQEWFPH
jgi:hypothetical protein